MGAPSVTAQLKPYFRYPFEDREARSRFMTGSALVLAGFIIPVLPGLFAYGYALRVLRSIAEGKPPTMPAWDDWTGFLSLGVRGAIIGLLYMLPGLLVFAFGMMVYFGAFILLPLSSDSQTDESGAMLTLLLLAMGTLFLSMAVGLALVVLGGVPLPAALSHFAVQDQLGAAFRFREWWPILAGNPWGYFISLVMVFGVFGIAYYLFLILYSTLVLLCLAFVILAPVSFYAFLLAASMFGEAYREGSSLPREPAKSARKAGSRRRPSAKPA